MIERATNLIRQAGLGNRAEGRETPILDHPEFEKFDVTLAIGVFDYTKDLRPFLKKIGQITASRFLAIPPRFWTWRLPVRKARLGILGCPVYFSSRSHVGSLLAGPGFKCERIEVMGTLFCVVAVPDSKP